MDSFQRKYTGYYIINGFIYGPKKNAQFYIKNNRIYKTGGLLSRYYIAGGFVYGPGSRGVYSVIGGKIYGPSTPPWL